MATKKNEYSSTFVLKLVFLLVALTGPGGESIGVCYGMNGRSLPATSAVVALYQSKNINSMRLYYPDPAALQALRGSNLGLLLGLPNEQLRSIAGDPSAATSWVRINVQAYSASVNFRFIVVGNELIPGSLALFVLPAMRNIKAALSSAGLGKIKVSTSVAMSVLGVSYPPSAGAFSSSAQSLMAPIINFLASTSTQLLVNVYPYFSYISNKNAIDLRYALFTSPGTVVIDGAYSYQNLFDAMVDAMYWALARAGGPNVPIIVSETGWPSAGGDAATVENAQKYNQNLINHVSRGTPRKPGALETYIFAMFNEDLKRPAGVENNWGLFYPNQQPVYPIHF